MTPNDNDDYTAFLGRDIGEHIFSRLELMALQPKHIFVVGSEVDFCGDLLKKRYPEANVVMSNGELEIIAVGDHSVDLIFANLQLPWCENLKSIFKEWRRVLRPQGLLMFSTLGPDTLIELQEKNLQDMLLYLMDMHDVGDELIRTHFADPVLDVEYLNVTYRELNTLIHELQLMKMIAFDTAPIQLLPTKEGIFSLTFEIIYGHAWGPSPEVDQVADDSGVVKIPLTQLQKKK